jgi:Flp pilus assembly protein TadD
MIPPAMSLRKKTYVRWLWPGIILVFVCAGLTIVMLGRRRGDESQTERQSETHVVSYKEKERNSSDSRPPGTTPELVKSEKALPVPGTNGSSITRAVTNQPGVEDHEDRVVALVTEGNQLLGQGNYAEAVKKFEQAVTLSPDQEDLHYNLAIALARLGKAADAKKHYEEALRIFPDYAEAHNNLGNLLMNENKLEEAITRFREAISNMPENASFHNNLGTAFGRQGKVAEAMGEFEEAIKHSPTYVEARVNLANTFLATGRADEAIAQLNEALRLRPDFKPALQTMQRARQRQDSTTAPK